MSPYTTEDLDYLWSDQYTVAQWANVERALLTAQAEHGVVPIEWAELAANTPIPTVWDWREHTRRTRHEVVGFLNAWGLEHVHIGATSSDIIDTANALRYKAINDHISTDAHRMTNALIDLATRTLDTPRLGRTHGQPAVPTTFGSKIADIAAQARRGTRRLDQARHDVETGKINGPTGGHHCISPAVEATTLDILSLQPAGITTQIIARDSLAHYAATLIGLIGTCAALATEIRLSTHEAIDEMYIQFDPGYEGSSAMPHKRNPSDAERISGLARIARSTYAPLAESVEQWHERDIAQSSVERVLMPQLTGLAHYCIKWATRTATGLGINNYPALRNLHMSLDAGTHAAMYAAQTAGLSYHQARIGAVAHPVREPNGPDTAWILDQLHRLTN